MKAKAWKLAAASAVALLAACASAPELSPQTEARAWSAARYADTPYAYELYLRGYAGGPHAQAARDRVDSLGRAERDAWARAREVDREAAYTTYLTAYPWGADVHTARSRREALAAPRRAAEESTAWDAARRADGIENYEHYLHTYPAGAHAETARVRLAELWTTEDGARLRARRAGSPSNYSALLSADPRLSDEQARRDGYAWGSARRRDTTGEYERYLRDQPDGAYRREAERRMYRLENDDRAEWERAMRSDTVTAYEDYRRSHSSGAYWDDAARRIDQLRAQQAFPPPAPYPPPLP